MPPARSPPPSRQDSESHSIIPALLVATETLAYSVFVYWNLSSRGVDRQAGWVLLLNVPVLLLWFALLLKPSYDGSSFGFLAVGVQCLIILVMLVVGIGQPDRVVTINGCIIAIHVLLTGVCYWFQGRRGRRFENE